MKIRTTIDDDKATLTLKSENAFEDGLLTAINTGSANVVPRSYSVKDEAVILVTLKPNERSYDE